jgi:organic radical activating enzyme
VTSDPRAPLVEVFSSIQGEGAFVGEQQSFVRLAVCPLRCRYCDSEHTWVSTDSWRVNAGGIVASLPNPASVAEVAGALAEAEKPGPRRTVSITGGEPLVHAEFLRALLPQLKNEGRQVHLETAGVHSEALAELLPFVDHVSADIKIRSTMETGDFAKAHEKFLGVCARAGADVCVKCVITPSVTDEEFDRAVGLVAGIAREWLFVVQPVTPCRLESAAVGPDRAAALAARASLRLPRVRVIPQVHRALGLP